VTILSAVDREEIERSDFPVARRGYDTGSVDAHLRHVADEFEGARSASPRASLAAGASEQVRLILEAAEQSATQLREDAERTASGHVERVSEAAAGLVGRLDELQGELDSLLDGLRKSAERLTEGLAGLHAQARDLQPEPEAAAPPEPEPDPEPEPEAEPEPRATEADEAGARIIALNMALGGSSRDETAAYLAEHFTLADPGALLDDVYAKVGQ
jgi:DivIVA domain-containing protein